MIYRYLEAAIMNAESACADYEEAVREHKNGSALYASWDQARFWLAKASGRSREEGYIAMADWYLKRLRAIPSIRPPKGY
jgi:hypothetical protein